MRKRMIFFKDFTTEITLKSHLKQTSKNQHGGAG